MAPGRGLPPRVSFSRASSHSFLQADPGLRGQVFLSPGLGPPGCHFPRGLWARPSQVQLSQGDGHTLAISGEGPRVHTEWGRVVWGQVPLHGCCHLGTRRRDRTEVTYGHFAPLVDK